MRQRVYEILEIGRPGDQVSRATDIALMFLIISNMAALVASTVDGLYSAAPDLFHYFELVSISIFTAEYLLRLWACTADPKYSGAITGRLRYMLLPLMLIDLAAVLPFFIIPLLPVEGLDLRGFRALRLLSRAARLPRYVSGLRALGQAVESRRGELLAVVTVLAILLVLAASLMYFAEEDAQPEEFSSIPAAMWWSIITVTTVGYGDVAPVTVPGRVLAGVIAILGIGIFALPAGILGSGFMEQMQQRDSSVVRTCPNCGHELHG